MKFYAHTAGGHKDKNITDAPWEPLFTPFGTHSETGCLRGECPQCENLEPQHGHLNKVAWWAAKFAAEMFPAGPDREAAKEWGHLAGLWHDLGDVCGGERQ